MKLKSKIIAAGISMLTISTSGMIFYNNFNIENYSFKDINNNSSIKEVNKEQITTLEELDKYIPGSSTGTYIKILNNGFLGHSYSDGNIRLNIHNTPTPSNNKIRFEEVPGVAGDFYLHIENSSNQYGGYVVQCIKPELKGEGMYANQIIPEEADRFEVWNYKDEILILPKIFSPSNHFPEEQEIGEYYDINFKNYSQSTPLETQSTEFPTDDILDGWNFKVEQDIFQEISNIKPDGLNSISLDIKQPSSRFTDLTPTSFGVSIDGQEITPINMSNPGKIENFIIDSEIIDHAKTQEITLNFGDFFGEEKFTTTPIASTIDVYQYSEKQINVDISNFLNGTGFTEATDFQIIINDVIDEKNKYSISELSEDRTTKKVDISNFISEETIEVKIKYLNSNFELFSTPIEVQLKKNIMGNFSLEDLYRADDQNTYGKVKVNIFEQDLLPVITHAKITATRIDGVVEEPKITNVVIPEIPQETITQELNLSHPSEYRIDIEYINEENPISIELLGSPEPLNGIETIKTRTGVTATTLTDKTNLLENIGPDSFSITGEFNVGHDEFGIEHPGETFELYLNGVLFDSNLLSGDNSNIEYPAFSKGKFNKTYENIDLSIYNGLELDVETDLEIMLNGSQVWTSKIKFYKKMFELPTITIKNLSDTTATVSYEEIIQGNGQQLATQYDFSLFTVSNEGNKILVPEYTENDKLLSESKTHNLINLTPGLTYEANMKFKHDDGTIIANLSTKIFTTKKIIWTMISTILLSTLIFIGIKFITKRRTKIEFE